MTIPSESGNAATHILVIPYPAQGHMIPLLDLTHHIAARGGLTITILVTPMNLSLLNPLLSHHHSPSSSSSSSFSSFIQPLALPFPPPPATPAGAENTKDLPPNSFRPMMVALGRLYYPLLDWIKSQPSPPAVIISDMFLGWTHRLAFQLGIKRVVFSPSGALALSVIYSLWRDHPKQPDDNDDGVVSFSKIPGSPKYPWRQLSQIFRSHVEGDVDCEFIKDGFSANLESWGLVINSFTELEGEYVSHLMSELGHNRVWALGPLLPPGAGEGGLPTDRGGSSSVEVGDILSWLDTCEDHEVVYVCFGSQAVLTSEQMAALGLALERSGARFIWAMRKGRSDGGQGMVPPHRFEEGVVGRGMVIKGWAPQVQILRHRAVGAFLTHCGWNSIVEGIVAGVTMLAWPMASDQFSNATLLVEVLKVGVRVCEGVMSVPDPDELARVLADVVNVGWQADRRMRSSELQKAALQAIGEGGSSVKELDRMIKDLST
ncbi:hypothetical protein Dimus_015436 [Dionaea muscipula]